VNVLSVRDVIISFNYDCLIEASLTARYKDKWDERFGYGFNIRSTQPGLVDETVHLSDWVDRPSKTPKLLKLHGSMSFDVRYKRNGRCGISFLGSVPYSGEAYNPDSALIFPQSTKAFEEPPFNMLWVSAAKALQRATELFIVGYSFPLSDFHSDMLFRLNVGMKRDLKRIVIINPDFEARARARHAVARGIGLKTKVIELNSLSELPSLLIQRKQWISWESFTKQNERLVKKNLEEAQKRFEELQNEKEDQTEET
jgi:hypothetical protein